MAVETIYTPIEKIMLKKEGSLSVCTGTRIPENPSVDGSGFGSVGTDPCNDCRAGYQSERRVLGPRNRSERRDSPARGRNRYDASSHHPKPSLPSFLLLFLLSCFCV